MCTPYVMHCGVEAGASVPPALPEGRPFLSHISSYQHYEKEIPNLPASFYRRDVLKLR